MLAEVESLIRRAGGGSGLPEGGNPGDMIWVGANGPEWAPILNELLNMTDQMIAEALAAYVPPGGGGGLPTRSSSEFTTSALAAGATATGTLDLAPSYRLLRIATDRPARVRLYTNAAKRDADLDRPIGVKPTGDHGRVFEAILTPELPAFDCSPVVNGFTEDATVEVPYSITTTSPAGGAVTVTLLWIPTE